MQMQIKKKDQIKMKQDEIRKLMIFLKKVREKEDEGQRRKEKKKGKKTEN